MIPDEVLRRWDITPIEYLGRRHNEHWFVESRGTGLVLRGYPKKPFADIAYELDVLRHLFASGWPVPNVTEEPVVADGRTWCLFSRLPGGIRRSDTSPEQRRARGRVLAQLHDATSLLAGMGQREGFSLSNEVVRDPDLVPAVREYERVYPAEGHVMRWHIDRALEDFASIDLDGAETTVVHGDFAPWNLLFEGERLTGILDFEVTHLGYRVADFANSWRGYQDEVIGGYEEVHPLNEVDWQLLAPVYFAWMFIGVKDEINAMLSGETPFTDFEWQIRHLVRREGLLGQRADRYPGMKGLQ